MVTLAVVVAAVGVLTALSHAPGSVQLAAKSGGRTRLALALARAGLWQTVLLAQLELARVVDELEGAHVDVLELASWATRLGGATDAAGTSGLLASGVVLVAIVDTVRPHSWWSQVGLNEVSKG